MNHLKILGSSIVMLGLLTAGVQADLNHLVPVPVTLTVRADTFTVPKQLYIFSDGAVSDSNVCWVKKLFDQLHTALPASYDTAIHVPASYRAVAHVRLLIITNATLGNEGYVLTITRDSILIAAQTTRGQFYGIQTIRQMLPPQIENASTITAPQKLPGCVIIDYPRFPMRGTHFDIARHFHNMTYLRQLIDRLALYKGNTLHLHLSDDQGFRIVINPPGSATGATITAYNNLTAVGGQWQVGGACTNCFFTQAQVRDSLVKYAIERKVQIIPELDMPGHIQAAIASFGRAGITISSNCWAPNCDSVYIGTGVGQSNLMIAPISAVVDTFVRTVWTQLNGLFLPTFMPYLHMGGDETPVTGTTYSTFVKRVETIINGLGRTLMGWEDIYGYTNNASSITQTWNNGNDHTGSVFSWCVRVYYDQPEVRGLPGTNSWCIATLPLATTYSASTSVVNHIGVLGTMWTEMTTQALDYAAQDMFSRHLATAELGWSALASLNFANFCTRVAPFACRFACMGHSWYPSASVTWTTCHADSSATKTNAYSNYNWNVIPTTLPSEIVISYQKIPVYTNFGALPEARYTIVDVRGRVMGVSSGKNLDVYNKLKTTASGIYFVVDRKGNVAQKIVRR